MTVSLKSLRLNEKRTLLLATSAHDFGKKAVLILALPFVLKDGGAADFGIYVTAQSLLGFFVSLIGFELWRSFEVRQLTSLRESAKISCATLALSLCGCTASVLIVICVVCSDWFLSSAPSSSGPLLIIAVSALVFISPLLTIQRIHAKNRRNIGAIMRSELASVLVFGLGLVFLVMGDTSFPYFFAIEALSGLVAYAGYQACMPYGISKLALAGRVTLTANAKVTVLINLLRESSGFVVGTLRASYLGFFDKFVLLTICGPAEAGIYASCAALVAPLKAVSNALVRVNAINIVRQHADRICVVGVIRRQCTILIIYGTPIIAGVYLYMNAVSDAVAVTILQFFGFWCLYMARSAKQALNVAASVLGLGQYIGTEAILVAVAVTIVTPVAAFLAGAEGMIIAMSAISIASVIALFSYIYKKNDYN